VNSKAESCTARAARLNERGEAHQVKGQEVDATLERSGSIGPVSAGAILGEISS
jgi:hypothetical protein